MKDKIIHKASELFLKLGFKSVTMDDIATEMGISKKTIYSHFKNKTSLVKQCAFSVLDTITKGIDEICTQNLNPIDELFEIKKFVMQELKDDQYSPQFQLEKYYPDINKEIYETHFEKMMESTIRNIKRGIEQGIYRETLDVDFIARIYFMGINGLKNQDLFSPKIYSSNFIVDEYLEYHLRGIVTEKGLIRLRKFIKENLSDDQ
ncbi:MAG TPA: TetR/AcrR family transcriptional regulator [Aequorivita sp.]|nr:TetR/AcrR family transcriptional regulator [Aequorivita sp.]